MTNKATDNDERKLEVFLAFRRRLLGHAGRILRDRAEAEDVVQEAFMRWQEHAADLRTPEAWLTTVTTRIAIDRMRRNERHALSLSAVSTRECTAVPAGAVDRETSGESDPALLPQLADGFRLLFSRLTEDERKVLVLREGFEFDFEEIAALTGKSVQNCRQIASRAKQRLSQHAGQERLLPADGRELARQCVDAFRVGDSQSLMRLLCLQPSEFPALMKPGVEMHAAHAQASAPTLASVFVSHLLLQMLARVAYRAWMGLAVVDNSSCAREAEAVPLSA